MSDPTVVAAIRELRRMWKAANYMINYGGGKTYPLRSEPTQWLPMSLTYPLPSGGTMKITMFTPRHIHGRVFPKRTA